jgi:hypothetical protein
MSMQPSRLFRLDRDWSAVCAQLLRDLRRAMNINHGPGFQALSVPALRSLRMAANSRWAARSTSSELTPYSSKGLGWGEEVIPGGVLKSRGKILVAPGLNLGLHHFAQRFRESHIVPAHRSILCHDMRNRNTLQLSSTLRVQRQPSPMRRTPVCWRTQLAGDPGNPILKLDNMA